MTTIVHTTALTDADRIPFEHGVALAGRAGARLLSIHADDDESDGALPDPSSLLARWHWPADRLRHRAIVHRGCDDPVETLLGALDRDGLSRLFITSWAETIVHHSNAPVLVLPHRSRGFITASGQVLVKRIVIPAYDQAGAATGIEHARWFAELADIDRLELHLVHLGDRSQDSYLRFPRGWTVVQRALDEDPERLGEQYEGPGTLLVVSEDGRDQTLGERVFGTLATKILRNARCPVLMAPRHGVPPSRRSERGA
ncbi:MAG: universal stress protein [Myxococcota bacterium]